MTVVFEDEFASGLVLSESRHGGKDTQLVSTLGPRDLWPQPYFKAVVVRDGLLALGCSCSRLCLALDTTAKALPQLQDMLQQILPVPVHLSFYFSLQLPRSTSLSVMLPPTSTHSHVDEGRGRHHSVPGLAEFQDLVLSQPHIPVKCYDYRRHRGN